MKKAYYARPISIDGTPQANRDISLIHSLGYAVTPSHEQMADVLREYAIKGMYAFKSYVEESDLLIFRAFPDGSIGSGVAREVYWATEAGVPVVEFPRQIERRTLTVEHTYYMLAELGQR